MPSSFPPTRLRGAAAYAVALLFAFSCSDVESPHSAGTGGAGALASGGALGSGGTSAVGGSGGPAGVGGTTNDGGTSAGGASAAGGATASGGSGTGGGRSEELCDAGVGDGLPPQNLELTGDTFAHDPTMIEADGIYYRFWT